MQRDDIDRLENYSLEHGINGGSWSSKAPWRYHRQWSLGQNEEQRDRELKIEAQLNSSRLIIYQHIFPLYEALTNRDNKEAITVREITETLFSF